MNNIKYISIISIALLTFFACKKKEATPAVITTPPAPLTAITVTTIPEQVGYQKVFNVIQRTITTPTNTGVSIISTDAVYTCTYTIIADTTLPGNIIGKKYLVISSNNPSYPTKAYSYYNLIDSTWCFYALNLSNNAYNVNLKLPLTANKTWTLNSLNYTDYLTNNGQTPELVNNVNTMCFNVTGNGPGVNLQFYTYKYFINNKGIVKFFYDDVYFTNPAQSLVFEFELNMISCNY